ncbi:hypothetical protein [Antrihabitans cavernicola]|uniref:Uncharacterized protein n=1 Tax=Antrihabitans cavernicola TaxID=2495913 RepID=A0A5A7S6Z6_9NOCA|nr:hypothetical protein [Spelaeibacter cavernicola]KAA0021928.1 hypothetical protein FOY51_16180 [Spelaeibacter cavernicola]
MSHSIGFNTRRKQRRQSNFRWAATLVVGGLVAVLVPAASTLLSPAIARAATPAFVQVASTSVTAASLTLPLSATSAGNLLAVYTDWGINASSATVTDNAGDAFTSVAAPTKWNNNAGYSQVFYAKNLKGGATSVTVTYPASSSVDAYAVEYSGLDTTNPLDVSVAAQGNSASLNSGQVATTYANDLLLGVAADNGTPTAPGAGYTLRSTASDNIVEDKTVTASGSYSASATMSPSASWVMHLVAFRAAGATRDPLQQPFASTSIWNMPIGTGAQYTPANLPADPEGDPWAPTPNNDFSNIIFTPTAPATSVYYSSAGWDGPSRCAKTGNQLQFTAPIPSNYVVGTDGYNEGVATLAADKRTVNIAVAFARCTAGGYATSNDYQSPAIDLYGNGLGGVGAGGTSGNPGGVIRLGELRPGQKGPAHALRITLDTTQDLFKCTTISACYTWPANGADGDAVGKYGTFNNNTNTWMKMGTLLAIPQSVDISTLGLQTEPAKELAWTLQNYGAYVNDDAGGASFAFVTERSPNGWFGDLHNELPTGPPAPNTTQFFQDYGFDFSQRFHDNTPWTNDVAKLMTSLSAVKNNGPTSIGGGGTPLQPLAPPITPP